MYGLPQSTEVRQALPKAQIYKQFDLKQPQRDLVDANFSRLDFVNRIAPSTLPAIAIGNEVKAIFVVAVELKRSDYDARSINLIAKLIPQNIVFALCFDGKVQLAVYHTKLFTAPWQPEDAVSISLSGLNLDTVWQNIVSSVGEMVVADGNSLTEQIRVDKKRNALLRQIDAMEREMRSTSQHRRQRELYSQLKKLKIQLNG